MLRSHATRSLVTARSLCQPEALSALSALSGSASPALFSLAVPRRAVRALPLPIRVKSLRLFIPAPVAHLPLFAIRRAGFAQSRRALVLALALVVVHLFTRL